MESSFILEVLQNIAILLAFSMMYNYFWAGRENELPLLTQIAVGLFITAIGFILISTPWDYQDGIFFDARSILLAIAGLFFGFVPTLIAMVLLSVYRYSLDGFGMWMGIASIISSGTIGIIWKKVRPNWKRKNQYIELFVFGFVTHVVMLFDVLFLPIEYRVETLLNILPIVLSVYPIGTVLLGILMIKQLKNRENEVALKLSEERWHHALEGVGDFLWDMNIQSDEIFISDRLKQIVGLDSSKKTFSWADLVPLIHIDFVDKLRSEFDKLKKNEIQQLEIEFKIKKKDGGYMWVLDRGTVMSKNELGYATRCIGTFSDISQRKIIEKNLYDSQLKLKKFTAHLHNDREDERVVLAREIHDELGQALVAMKMELGMLQTKVVENNQAEGSNVFVSQIKHLTSLIDNLINTTRRIMTDLRPELLDILGILDTIRHYCVIFEKKYNIKCRFENEIDTIELDTLQQVALFRIVQEALMNVAKHAQATQVDVLLILDENSICFEISDNGIGFDINEKSNLDLYGLIGMKERTYLFGGTFHIESEHAKGTKIKINIPNRYSVLA